MNNKSNKWLLWVLLSMSILSLGLPGMGVFMAGLIIYAALNYDLVPKPKSDKKKKSIEEKQRIKDEKKQIRLQKREERKQAVAEHMKEVEKKRQLKKEAKIQVAIEHDKAVKLKSLELFDVSFVDEKILSLKTSNYYRKVRNDNEVVLDVKRVSIAKKQNYNHSFSLKKIYDTEGILVLTTDNLYYLSSIGGFTKEVFSMPKINGMRKIDNYGIEVTYGRSKKYFIVLGNYKEANVFIDAYMSIF